MLIAHGYEGGFDGIQLPLLSCWQSVAHSTLVRFRPQLADANRDRLLKSKRMKMLVKVNLAKDVLSKMR